MTPDVSIDIATLTVEGASPRDATRLRAVIEAAFAQVARQLAARPGSGPAQLDSMRLDLGEIRTLLAPGAETELARRLESAIRAAWEDAR
ncbi:hypothetical protein ACEUZ9_000664 [Paracoccus litorisediminis]|uniref:Uncharacterized protein n=1 Tax=Paracoccus litorisediminis TaxID=2006130 RepID=A0A844HK91_9RHOB|nr:hypothetical protein [Paracoccus litorisediminis]MTH59469.1 hypothetical protein [Paracoccus litorisediminis]